MLLALWSLALPAAGASDKPPYDHVVSLTFSPIHLALPLVEVQGEGRAADKVGVAGIVGIGTTQGHLAWELGAQARVYPIGDFDHGMQVGAEAMVLRVSTSEDDSTSAGVGAGGGAFLGYKIAARFGLTLDLQAGAQLYRIVAHATDGDASATAAATAFGPLVNLNLGWSF